MELFVGFLIAVLVATLWHNWKLTGELYNVKGQVEDLYGWLSLLEERCEQLESPDIDGEEWKNR